MESAKGRIRKRITSHVYLLGDKRLLGNTTTILKLRKTFGLIWSCLSPERLWSESFSLALFLGCRHVRSTIAGVGIAKSRPFFYKRFFKKIDSTFVTFLSSRRSITTLRWCVGTVGAAVSVRAGGSAVRGLSGSPFEANLSKAENSAKRIRNSKKNITSEVVAPYGWHGWHGWHGLEHPVFGGLREQSRTHLR